MKKIMFYLFLLSPTLYADEPLLLNWIDLIPEKERHLYNEKEMPVFDHNSDGFIEQNKSVAVRSELHQSEIKIPGFVIPLEMDGKNVTEFLLVPYFGACIHVPPPPANQIIHVKLEKAESQQALWDVVYVVGNLIVTATDHDDIQSSYQLHATKIEIYEEQGYEPLFEI